MSHPLRAIALKVAGRLDTGCTVFKLHSYIVSIRSCTVVMIGVKVERHAAVVVAKAPLAERNVKVCPAGATILL